MERAGYGHEATFSAKPQGSKGWNRGGYGSAARDGGLRFDGNDKARVHVAP